MKFSELKSNAKIKIAPHIGDLRKSAIVYLIIQAVFLILSITLGEMGKTNAGDWVNQLSIFLLVPLWLANIAMVTNIYTGGSVKTGIWSYFKTGKSYWRSMFAYLLPTLFVSLWTLPFTLLLGIFIVVDSVNEMDGINGTLFILLAVILGIIAIIVSTIKSLQYFLSPYLLVEDEGLSPYASIRDSKNLMKGYKWKLFLLILSFIGWFLLIPLTLGIMLVFVMPYFNATIYEFYEQIKKDKNPLPVVTEDIVEPENESLEKEE